jgi:molybdopterin molybdotransferase
VFVTFVNVVRPLLASLAGERYARLPPLAVRAAFSYRKKKGRREYVRARLARATDGAIEACKYQQDGAGVLTSLTETDGLIELAEERLEVMPGSTVGFLPYATLIE